MTRPATVLIVDDEPAIRRAMDRALTRLGYAVQQAGSGEAALDVLSAQAVDVILLDLRMPGMSGQTLFHSIVARWPHLVSRVIIMTGDIEAEDHHEWLRIHQLPILHKPFELAELETVVKQVASRAEGLSHA
jgi:DNA-binding response OmpR family regulator